MGTFTLITSGVFSLLFLVEGSLCFPVGTDLGDPPISYDCTHRRGGTYETGEVAGSAGDALDPQQGEFIGRIDLAALGWPRWSSAHQILRGTEHPQTAHQS